MYIMQNNHYFKDLLVNLRRYLRKSRRIHVICYKKHFPDKEKSIKGKIELEVILHYEIKYYYVRYDRRKI